MKTLLAILPYKKDFRSSGNHAHPVAKLDTFTWSHALHRTHRWVRNLMAKYILRSFRWTVHVSLIGQMPATFLQPLSTRSPSSPGREMKSWVLAAAYGFQKRDAFIAGVTQWAKKCTSLLSCHYGGPTTATCLLHRRSNTFFVAESAHDEDQNGTPKGLTELGPREPPKSFVGIL